MLAWAQKNRSVVLAAAGATLAAGAIGYYYYKTCRPPHTKAPQLTKKSKGAKREGSTEHDEPHKTFGEFRYPATAMSNHRDKYWGVEVPDPFNWLEDPDAPAVNEWIAQQNKCTDDYFERFSQQRNQYFEKLSASFVYDKYGVPWQRGPYLFFSKKEGLQNQAVYYMQESLEAEPRVILDPNTIREDGTAAVKGPWICDDGTKMAYGVSLSGSDWFTIYVRDILTCKDMEDKITWCKFSNVAWTKDNSGFFYSKYPSPKSESGEDSAGTEVDAASGQRVYFHQIGTAEGQDQLVYESSENPKWLYGCEVTDDGKTLMLTITDSCDPVNRLFLFDLSHFDGKDVSGIGKCVKLVDTFEHEFAYITNNENEFIFKTNMNAPRYKVIKMIIPSLDELVDAETDALSAIWHNAVEIISQSEGVLLGVTTCVGDVLALKYLQDVKEVLELCDMNGQHRIPLGLPSLGTVIGPTGIRESNRIFYQFMSFQDAGSTFMAEITHSGDAITYQTTLTRSTEVPGLDPSDFETAQVFYESKDGTKIPMFIVRRAANGTAPPTSPLSGPCLLYGYGGFNISIGPHFSTARLLFVKHFNGIYCVANIRGGGEYGEDWHKQGTKHEKQNCFDDFIAAAEYLIKEKHTTRDRLAIQGGSNGGLLVGACVNQRPDLFAAAIPQVGVMDMLKFHKFTIGYAWCSDYGCSEASPEEFRSLYAYSPLHNIRAHIVQYPATLVLTADHDDRVVPLHSFKYIATLQSTIGSRNDQHAPLLIKIATKAGHGAGKPTQKVLEESADVCAFIAYHTGATWTD